MSSENLIHSQNQITQTKQVIENNTRSEEQKLKMQFVVTDFEEAISKNIQLLDYFCKNWNPLKKQGILDEEINEFDALCCIIKNENESRGVHLFRTLLNQVTFDLNTQDEKGNTLLMYACCYWGTEHQEIAKFLVEQESCNLNIQNKKGQTALMIAMKTASFGVAKCLALNEKCNVNIQDNKGDSALFYLTTNIAGYNLAENANGISSKILTFINLNPEEIDVVCDLINSILLRKDFKPESNTTKWDWTFLMTLIHITAMTRNNDLIRSTFVKNIIEPLIKRKTFLLEKEDLYGSTSLTLACEHSAPDIVSILIENDYPIQYPIGSQFKPYTDLMHKEFNRRQNILIQNEIKSRNAIGVLLLSAKKQKIIQSGTKRKLDEMKEEEINPISQLSIQLIHSILAQSHPLAPQKKYCLRKQTNEN